MGLLGYLISKKSTWIIAAFVFCYAVTASIFQSFPSLFSTELTAFASLMYLPHGVSVLAIMLFGWKAFPALIIGNLLGDLMFKPAAFVDDTTFMWVSPMCIAILSSYLAFEIFRHLGKNLYAREDVDLNWKEIIAVGTTAAVINAISQNIVFDQILSVGHDKLVYWIYAIGNVWGLLVLLIGLMIVFRWVRFYRQTK